MNTETNTKKRGRKALTLPEGFVVDWTKTNKQLGAELGVSSLTVFKLRKRMGAPANKRGARSGSKHAPAVANTVTTPVSVSTEATA